MHIVTFFFFLAVFGGIPIFAVCQRDMGYGKAGSRRSIQQSLRLIILNCKVLVKLHEQNPKIQCI